MPKLPLVILSIIAVSCVSDAYKILVIFPMPARSHDNLGKALVRHLLNAGHEVTHVTLFPQRGNNPKHHEIDLSSNLGAFPTTILNLKLMMENKISNIMKNYFLFISVLVSTRTLEHENFQKMLADQNQEFDLVIAEWMFSELYAGVAAVYGAPLIWFSTIEPHWMILSLIDEYPNPAYNGYDVVELPPFTFMQRITELWFTTIQTILRETILLYMHCLEHARLIVPHIEARGKTAPSFEEARYNASLVFGNSHVSMGSATRLPQNYKPVGGYHVDDNVQPLPEDLKKIIDEAKHGVIYFSMGSNLSSKDLPEEVKKRLLKLFASLKQTIVWKYEEDLSDAPENVHIVKWAPQQSILAHPNVLIFITHGGLLSTTETIFAGKPIIGIPVFFDQFINVARAVNKGFAKKVDLSYSMVEDLQAAIEDILTDPKYTKKAKELSFIHHDRPVKPGQEIVHWVEHVIKTNGAPHLRSPALLVPWYQKLYLDLVVIIILAFIVVRYLCRRILRLIFTNKTDSKIKTN